MSRPVLCPDRLVGMAHDHDHDVADDDLDFEDIDIKEALGLPDALPPIRLLPLSVLAAQARNSADPGPARRAGRLGGQGRPGSRPRTASLTPDDLTAVTAALGVDEDDLGFLWEYALAVEWLVFDEGDEDRVEPGETADDWISGDDEQVVAAWASTFAAVLGETLLLYGPDLAETRRRGRGRGRARLRLRRPGDGHRRAALPRPPGRADGGGVRRGAVGERRGRARR